MPGEPLSWHEGNSLVQSVGREQWAAQRIKTERERRGWSQSELARRLEGIGPHLPQTAISKIERESDRRAITVDEAIAFATVFEIPLGELLLPPESVQHVETLRGLGDGRTVLRKLEEAKAEYEFLVEKLAERLVSPEWKASLIETVTDAEAQRDVYHARFIQDVLDKQAQIEASRAEVSSHGRRAKTTGRGK